MSINIILAEENRYPIGSFIDQVKQKFPSSSTVFVNKNNVLDAMKVISRSPLLTEGWLVIINVKDISEGLISSFNVERNITIFVVRNNDELHETARKFIGANLQYKVVDNLNPSKETVELYIMEELKVDKELARYIARRHNYYLQKISESVEILKELPNISKEVIKKYTEKTGDLSYNAMFDYIIGADEEINPARVGRLVHKYRFGVEFMAKFIVKKFDLYLMVYDEVMTGKLSMENYKEYYEQHKVSLKEVNEYSLRKAIEATTMVSYEKLFYLSQLYKREAESGANVISLMGLLRLSKY
jgi:hypothetical protein